MAPIPPRMANFAAAMSHVYKFPTEATKEPWTPPPAEGHRGRYLWTDAFGVVNFLTLFKETQDELYLTHAICLVTAVHDILGRTRSGSAHLPGASDAHPLAGGLRIGKDDEFGPDGDGQYHHYLTLWMFALNRVSLASKDKKYNDLGIELAKAIHPRFVYDRNSGRPRMVWKMAMDLSKPLVHSEGNLDPIDGYVTFRLLQSTNGPDSTILQDEIADYEKIVQTKWEHYSSSDPLDLGMTLWTSHWHAAGKDAEAWASGLCERAERDLKSLVKRGYFERNIERRLAFREFGTCLGMRAALEAAEWASLSTKICEAWESSRIVPTPQGSSGAVKTAVDHGLLPITLVMYAAALHPGAFQAEFLS
ncbi:hypothetical protein NA57DRAFT_55567 [Rhizodiscina lignyota]|uniref:Uncharacterized protein n=1 Tax=Rhizodiscina lignyota TaxID=1504668 RepID=A0A9P4IET5_9PEZI|nr:hypothetical protein NA57DRAFT_55567 [Rhizodiscina lignyota]